MMGTQSVGENDRIGWSEIAKFNRVPDIERGDSLVANKIAGSCHSKQAKGEPVKLRFFRPAIVTLANAGEEFVRAEFLKTANSVDFVNEDDERFAFVFKINFFDRSHKPVKRRPSLIRIPEGFHLRLKV